MKLGTLFYVLNIFFFRTPSLHGSRAALLANIEKVKQKNLYWQPFDMNVQKYFDMGKFYIILTILSIEFKTFCQHFFLIPIGPARKSPIWTLGDALTTM